MMVRKLLAIATFVLALAAIPRVGSAVEAIPWRTRLDLALDRPLESLERERRAAGVMMIPIPRAGRLVAVRGVEEAEAVEAVDDVVITMHPGQEVIPLPEGWQYLGFIFARAERPAAVEAALRKAHARLRFDIA